MGHSSAPPLSAVSHPTWAQRAVMAPHASVSPWPPLVHPPACYSVQGSAYQGNALPVHATSGQPAYYFNTLGHQGAVRSVAPDSTNNGRFSVSQIAAASSNAISAALPWHNQTLSVQPTLVGTERGWSYHGGSAPATLSPAQLPVPNAGLSAYHGMGYGGGVCAPFQQGSSGRIYHGNTAGAILPQTASPTIQGPPQAPQSVLQSYRVLPSLPPVVESAASPLQGNLLAGAGYKPPGLPVTHTLSSMGQEWHGGLQPPPGLASTATQGVGYLLPQSASQLISGPVQEVPPHPPVLQFVGQGVGQASGLPSSTPPILASSLVPPSSLPPSQNEEGESKDTPEEPEVSPQVDPDLPETHIDSANPQAGSSDQSSLPALLAALESLCPELVAVLEQQPKLLTGPEAHAQAQKATRELRVPESPLIASILEETEREIRGLKGEVSKDETNKDSLVLSEKHLRSGTFLPSSRSRFKAFDKPAHPVALSALPARSLTVQEPERKVLPEFEGKSTPSFSATIPDGALADWEETLRLSLEHSSMLERFIDILYEGVTNTLPNKAELSEELAKALLVSSSSCAKAVLRFSVRAYLNVVLARRDALLAKSKSRVPSAEKEFLRTLQLDTAGLLGPKALLAPSLQPPTGESVALLKVAEALKARPSTSKPSPAKKRPFTGGSAKEKVEEKGKKAKFSGRGQGKSSSKPSTPKKTVSPP